MLPNNIPIEIKRRKLPHWRLLGAIYYVTFRLRARSLDGHEIVLVKQHVLSGNGRYYQLYAVQVMPDHVHLLFRPREGFTLSWVLKGIKGATARKLNLRRGRRGALWQDESFDRIVRGEKEFWEKLDYMFRNSLLAGLTTDPANYVGWYLNEEEE